MAAQYPLHILIVDQDIGAAQVTRAIVERAAPDARLTLEPDSEQARRNLPTLQPDVVIIDPSPAMLAGTQMIEAAKGAAHTAQVIVLASAPSAGLRRKMRDLGVDMYHEKPSPLLVADLRCFFERAPRHT
jgi:DNA-binding NarL/FixJ family response regulator